MILSLHFTLIDNFKPFKQVDDLATYLMKKYVQWGNDGASIRERLFINFLAWVPQRNSDNADSLEEKQYDIARKILMGNPRKCMFGEFEDGREEIDSFLYSYTSDGMKYVLDEPNVRAEYEQSFPNNDETDKLAKC